MFLCHLRVQGVNNHFWATTIAKLFVETICSVSLGASTAWYNQHDHGMFFSMRTLLRKAWVDGHGWVAKGESLHGIVGWLTQPTIQIASVFLSDMHIHVYAPPIVLVTLGRVPGRPACWHIPFFHARSCQGYDTKKWQISLFSSHSPNETSQCPRPEPNHSD